jgi:protein-S-isoprenylcysteine O-methyltransferase Ste14
MKRQRMGFEEFLRRLIASSLLFSDLFGLVSYDFLFLFFVFYLLGPRRFYRIWGWDSIHITLLLMDYFLISFLFLSFCHYCFKRGLMERTQQPRGQKLFRFGPYFLVLNL